MILVDTSVWIDHLRFGNSVLVDLLNNNVVRIHSMIIGELACGNLRKRAQLLTLWKALPAAREATHQEVMHNIDHNHLMGKGLGYVDTHLLTSAQITTGCKLWTLDKRFAARARSLGIAYQAN